MGKPIQLTVCNLSCNFKATSIIPTESWNGSPVQRSHDNDMILCNLHVGTCTSRAEKLLESH